MDKQSKKTYKAWLNGFIGVLIFSGSLPATRLAVMEFTPIFLTVARASIAGILALTVLLVFNENRPTKIQFSQLAVTAIGVVIGFPLFSAMALKYITSASSVVFIGILPLLTAVFGVIRSGERPKPAFWLFSILGALMVMGFAILCP